MLIAHSSLASREESSAYRPDSVAEILGGTDVAAAEGKRGVRRRRRPLILGLLAGGLCLWAPQLVQARTAYVVNAEDSTVTPIDTATNAPGPAIKVGSSPYGIALTPDGRTAYVANMGDSSVTPINTATGVPGAPIKVGGAAKAIAISPNGRTVYVVGGSGTFTPIDVATNTAGATIKIGGEPDAIAISPDGATAYVVNASGTVSPIEIATDTVRPAIKVGEEPEAIAITPDGRTAYVANGAGSNSVTPINTATGVPGTPIKVGIRPFGIAITPNGKTAYVANDSESTVTPIDLATNTPGTPIKVGSCPATVAITPDGATAYVANACPGTVTPISTATNKPGAEIKVGKAPSMIAITPKQPPTAAFSASATTLGQVTSFNASASTDSDGSIASYTWEFGDGTTLSTSTPTTTHTYAASGTYTARLTLVDAEGCSTTLVFTGQTAFCNGSNVASTTGQVTVAPVPVKTHPPVAPSLTATESHAVWRTGSHLASLARKRRPPVGTTFTFTLNEAAGVTLTFSQQLGGRKVKGRCVAGSGANRHKPSCRRSVRRGSLTLSAHAGVNKVSFQGRISASRTLKPGHYTLVITAANSAGQHSPPRSLSFTIVR
jgi:YVTN family beta-propeller protein